MARSQNGTTSRLRVNVGACNVVAGVTFAVIANITGRSGQWRNLLCQLNSSSTPQGYSFEVTSGNVLALTNLSVTGSSTSTVGTSDGHRLFTASKATGLVVPRLHSYRYADGSEFFENAASNFADGTLPGASGFIDLGGDAGGSGDWFVGDYALAGMWNAVLSDDLRRSLAFSLRAWFAVQPAGLWLCDQQATGTLVTDLTGGGANESSSTALGISTVSVPGFSYGAPLAVPTQDAGSGSQNVSPAHLSSGAALYAPTLAPGAVTVTPGTIASGAQLFAPTLAPTFTLTPARIDSTEQTFAPTLAPGAVTVTPGHIGSTEQVFAPDLGGGVAVNPDQIASTEQVFAPTLTVGSITVTPGHLASGAQVFQPTLLGGDAVAARGQRPTLGVG